MIHQCILYCWLSINFTFHQFSQDAFLSRFSYSRYCWAKKMPPRRATRNTRAKAPATLSPEDQQVIEAFWNNPTHPTNIVKLTQMHSYETSATCSWRTLTSSARTSKQRQSERQRQQQTPSPPSTGSLSSHSSRSEYLSKKIWNCLSPNLGYFETVCPAQPENLKCLSQFSNSLRTEA